MSRAARGPGDLLADLQSTDPGRPRITYYADPSGPMAGERIELSARVLANWVAKAANLLQDEFLAEAGTRVGLALPPHWRTAYWALATWSVGGRVVLGEDAVEADVVVSDRPGLLAEAAGDAVLVTLAGLARSAVGTVPPGALDEARTLATYADRFVATTDPDGGDPALTTGAITTAYEDLLSPAALAPFPARARVHLDTPDTGTFLRAALAVWAVDGSLVVTGGPTRADVLAARLAAEGVSVDLGGPR